MTSPRTLHSFDARTLGTILAALRHYQNDLDGSALRPDVYRNGELNAIATNHGAHEGLDAAGIDELCERLNVDDGSPEFLALLGELADYAEKFAEQNGEPANGGCRSAIAAASALASPSAATVPLYLALLHLRHVPALVKIAKAYRDALNASDSAHFQFLDSCADVVDLLWHSENLVRDTVDALEASE